MSVSFYSFFSLDQNFNWEQLEDSYHNKVDNLRKLNISNVDKQLYLEQIYRLYREAKEELTQRERSHNEYGILPWNNRLGLRNYMWDGMDYFDKLERRINKRLDNFYKRTGDNAELYGTSRSYSEKMLPDGSRLVIEKNSLNKNGKIQETTHSYKKLKDGTIETLEYDKARELIEN